MIHLTCPKTGGVIGVSPSHVATVAPSSKDTKLTMKGGCTYLFVRESSADVLALIEKAVAGKVAAEGGKKI